MLRWATDQPDLRVTATHDNPVITTVLTCEGTASNFAELSTALTLSNRTLLEIESTRRTEYLTEFDRLLRELGLPKG
jgi:hypothetical protein